MKNSRFYLAVTAGVTALFLFTGLGICAEVIIDDGDAGFTKTYGWNSFTGIPTTSYNRDCLRKPGWVSKDVSSCSYRPVLPESGEYEVYVWWPDPYAEVLNVPYIIHYSGGTETIYVNQGKNHDAGDWKLIGRWSFDKGSTGYVEVQSQTSSPGYKYVYADGMKFVYMGTIVPNQPPTAIIEYITPNPAQQGQQVSFKGRGEDDGSVNAYSWRSSIDGPLSTVSSFTKSNLSVGEHTIYFKVRDDDNVWSPEASQQLTISLTPPPPSPISKIPSLIRFQGRLTDSAGTPLDGSYSVTFRIYNRETGGNLKWQETQAGVNVDDGGVFSVLLGKVTPLNLNFDEDYWLSTEIGTNGEMTPRQRITSVGYAFRAETVNRGADVYSGHGDVSDNLYENVYIHLEGAPKSVKLYFWGEASVIYPDGVMVSIDGVDKTQDLLQMANINWKRTKTAFGDGSPTHPLVTGANGVTGTGELDITSLIAWSQGEHKITFSQSVSNKAGIRYNIYIKY